MLFPVIKGLRMESYRATLNLEGKMLPTPWAQCPLASGVTAPALFCCLGNILHLQHAQCSLLLGMLQSKLLHSPSQGHTFLVPELHRAQGVLPPNQHRATYRQMGRGEELWAMGILGNVVWISCGRFKHQHTTTEFLLQQTLQRGEEDHKPGLCALHDFSELTLQVAAQKIWNDPLHWTPPKSPLVLQVWYGSKHWGKEKLQIRAFLSRFVAVWWEVFISIRNRACCDWSSRLAHKRRVYEVSGHSFSTALSKPLISPLQEAFTACFYLSHPGRLEGALSRLWFGKG